MSDATLLSHAASELIYQETVEFEQINRQADQASSLHSLLLAADAVALGDRWCLCTTFTILRWLSILYLIFNLTNTF